MVVIERGRPTAQLTSEEVFSILVKRRRGAGTLSARGPSRNLKKKKGNPVTEETAWREKKEAEVAAGSPHRRGEFSTGGI